MLEGPAEVVGASFVSCGKRKKAGLKAGWCFGNEDEEEETVTSS